jgi:DNA replication protein DnaC
MIDEEFRQDITVLSNIAKDRGYKSYKSAPEPKICEFCGNILYHQGIVMYLGEKDRNGKDMIPKVIRWSPNPIRCTCELSKAWWGIEDKRVQEEKDNKEKIIREEELRRKVVDMLGKSGIKQRFLSRTFENYITDTPQRKLAYKTALQYATNFSTYRKKGRGLYIEGSFGTGKTHLAAAISIRLIENGYSVVMKTADDLLRDIKNSWKSEEYASQDSQSEKEIISAYKTCELLVIDDLGKERATEWSTSVLYAIINDRYESMKPTIVTTNFNERDLILAESPCNTSGHRIKAIMSRLHETTALITMNWEDWRTK